MTIETKLAQWRTLYGQLCEAESKLRAARAGGESGSVSARELEQEVNMLQQRCNTALDAVGAALAARRPHASAAGFAASSHPV